MPSPDLSLQQQETLDYFSKEAADWTNKARGIKTNRVNVIAQRNTYVLSCISSRSNTQTALDVGCGSGELVCAIAQRGIEATGIDFSPTLIATAQQEASAQKIARAHFICDSIFNVYFASATFDIVAANGFIEYISFSQRDTFFKLAWEALRPGGSLIVSSRNRLFNLFSSNSFTREELTDHTVEALSRELVTLTEGFDPIAALDLPVAPFPAPVQLQTNTGIPVSTRYQYTPLQLWQLLSTLGFSWKALSPIHIHCMVPHLKEGYPQLHVTLANTFQRLATNELAFLPQASAFMIHVIKPA